MKSSTRQEPALTADDERHYRSLSPKSLDDIEYNVVFAREIAICALGNLGGAQGPRPAEIGY